MRKRVLKRLLAATLCAGVLGTMIPAVSAAGGTPAAQKGVEKYLSGAPAVQTLPLKAREATEWTRLWDLRHGWIGSDGIFSFNLNGGDAIGSANENTKTFFIYSDTLAGDVNGDNLRVSGKPMMNHSAGTLTGNKADGSTMKFYYGYKADGSYTNLFNDPNAADPKGWWLMDGVVVGKNIYVTAIEVDGAWRVHYIHFVKIPIVNDQPDFENFTVIENLPMLYWEGENSTVFGNGIMPNTVEAGAPADVADGYIYIYGYRMSSDYHSELLVSRVKAETFEDDAALKDAKNWEYWVVDNDGNGSWKSGRTGLRKASVIMPNPVSNEASVTYITDGVYAGKYMAVYCRSGQNRTMEYAVADNPQGPFSEGVAFYDAPEAEDYPQRTYSYNAKAHPHLSSDGHLLVTYNVNNPDRWSATNELYRSRWVEIDLNTLADKPVLGDVSSHQPTAASGYINADSAPRYGADGGYWQHCWRDDTKGDKWLQIDLGKVKYVSRYILRNAGWADGKASIQNTCDWKFQVSLDGENWTDVDEVSGNAADKVVRDFEQTAARYVRIYITKPTQPGCKTSPDRATIASIEVYGTPIPVKKDQRVDVALGKPVTVSDGADTAANLVNGSWSTVRDRWFDGNRKTTEKWAVVDLQGAHQISKYIVRHAGAGSQEETYLNTNAFVLQASDDGETWRDIDRVDYNMHNVTEREVTPFTARYVRLYITKPALSSRKEARVYSLELYGDLAPNNGWWKLDEGAGDTAHDVANGNDAALTGGTSWVQAPFGGALQFDGETGIALAQNYAKPTTAATYAAWVRADAHGKWASIIKNWGENQYGQLALDLGEDSSHLTADVTQADGTIVKVRDDAEFPIGRWVHVALTADGKNLTLYRDGKAVATQGYNGTLKASGYDYLGIGAKPNDAGNAAAGSSAGYWKGAIGDVRVYNRALSEAELAEIIGRPVQIEKMEDRNVVAGATLESLELPKTVQVTYSDKTTRTFDVTWNTAALDLNKAGVYTLEGTYNGGEVCTIVVRVRQSYAQPDIGWWKLDEASGKTAENAVADGRSASIKSGATFAPAKFGNGLSFEKDNGFVLIKDYTKPATTATYSAWVYMNAYTTYGTILKNWGMDKYGQISLGLLESGGRVSVTMVQADGSEIKATDSNDFPLNQWNMVTVTADGEHVILYINDKEAARATYDGTLKTSGFAPLGLGAKPNDAGNNVASSSQGYLDGAIDDVRVYSWAITAEDVAAMYGTMRPEYRTALKAAIDAAKAKQTDAGYANVLPQVKAEFEALLTEAERTYADAALLQSDVDAAAQKLSDFRLVQTADKAQLKELIDTSATIDWTRYPAAEKTAFEAALAEAQAVLDKADATVEEISVACDKLRAAREGLTVWGDVNGDGAVDTADAVLVLQRAAKLIDDNALNAAAADVNGDNVIDTADAVLILQKAAKLINKFPVEG